MMEGMRLGAVVAGGLLGATVDVARVVGAEMVVDDGMLSIVVEGTI